MPPHALAPVPLQPDSPAYPMGAPRGAPSAYLGSPAQLSSFEGIGKAKRLLLIASV